MMPYQLYKSKRKTIAISFDGDGNLIVKAPFFAATADVERFLKEKQDWIEKTAGLIEAERKKKKQNSCLLENGDILYFLGEKRELTVLREDRARVRVKCVLDRILMQPPYDAGYEMKRSALEAWFRKEAAELLKDKAADFAKQIGVSFLDIRIKDQKSRWGSCSSKGNLNFNWRIVMAPEPVCDYVVIHELCHLLHMNHSESFWREVGRFCPAYKQYKKWLKENSGLLYRF